MQVARQNMPVSSIVVGVDLFPIKPIPGCISIVGDITTDKCRVDLTKELKTWKADIVLHDGAPNVGKNWLHDAYQQACLTLSSLKLATQFLRPGGWFVTKVFRSKDYHPLIWVFKQLFKKVHATKPQASRNESAEIFVVCQYYIAPDKIDSKFMDPKYVFQELEIEPKNKLNVFHPEMKKSKAEGYPDNDYTLHHTIKVSEFISSSNPIEVLQRSSEIVFDDKAIEIHSKTTNEIKECCKDIKVLGRKELRLLLNWHKLLSEELQCVKKEEPDVKKETLKVIKEVDEDEDEKMDTEIENQIAELKTEEVRELKRQRKKANKERKKLNERLNLKMVLKGDSGPTLEGDDMFNLKQIRDGTQLSNIREQEPDLVAQESDSEDEKPINKFQRYAKGESQLDSSGTFYKDSDSELEMESNASDDEKEPGKLGLSDSEASDEEDEGEKDDGDHPLITDLDNRDVKQKKTHKAELWFERDAFKNLLDENDEDYDLDRLVDEYKKKGAAIVGEDDGKKDLVENKNVEEDSDSDSDSDSEEETNYMLPNTQNGTQNEKTGNLLR